MENGKDDQRHHNTTATPLWNPRHRHVSRSAAKRDSVQLLGSIKDLQAHFARAGFVEHRAGAGAGVKGSNLNTLGEDDEFEAGGSENRRPSLTERRTERKTWKEVELPRIDPASARQEARRIAARMRATWGLAGSSSSGSSSVASSPSTAFHLDALASDTRAMLVSTAQSIRAIRNLALAIAHAHRSSDRRASACSSVHARTTSKPRSSFSTPSRPTGMPRAVSLGRPERKSSLDPGAEGPQEDIHADLRKAAIEVLASLRALEERLRVQVETGSDMTRTTSPIESVGTSSTAVDSSTAVASLRPASTESNNFYYEDEEEYNLNALAQADAEVTHTQTWEERLVAEDGRYRDVDDQAESSRKQVDESLVKWLRVVERIFHVSPDEITELGTWVDADEWTDRHLERLQTFLTSHLPLQLQLLLPSIADADFRSTFLPRISDGYLLIQVFNTVVLSSQKPWGFVADEDMHDTISADSGEGSKEWTFRRIGNLTCWAAALRHRYNLPINLPASATTSSLMPKPSSLPSRTPGPSPLLGNPAAHPKVEPSPVNKTKDAQRIDFDPSLVAKKEEEWEKMFEAVLYRWLEAAAAEAAASTPPQA